jgi:hypothetical protein
MQQVWILSTGEQHEGGRVLGVYADKELAKGQFVTEARNLHFAVDDAQQDPNGAIHLYAGCDFLSLEPHQLIVRNEIEA